MLSRLLAILLVLMATAALSSAQTIVASDQYATAGGSNSDHIVADSGGTLWMLLIRDDGAAMRTLELHSSNDGGTTWGLLPLAINDAMSGMTGPNFVNSASLAIDSQDNLHVIWGTYYYPSYYSQYYRRLSISTLSVSAVVNLTAQFAPGVTTRTSAMTIAVDQNDTIWIGAHGTSSWRTQLISSDQPTATNLAFTSQGVMSSTASAQNARLAVDATGTVHCSYYRNTGSGEYWHRLYIPGVGYGTESLLGNSQPTNDFYGAIAADSLGAVHALYTMDNGNGSTWLFAYKRWDPVSGWGPEISLFNASPNQYTGISSYRSFDIACEESTGKVTAIYRDLANGGALRIAELAPGAASFTPMPAIAPASSVLNDYLAPGIRGSLYPSTNQTGSDIDASWRQGGAPGPYQHVFQRLGSSGPAATLTLVSPAVIGQSTLLDLNSPADPLGAYWCGLSVTNSTGIVLSPTQTFPLDFDPLLQLTLQQVNGILFNHYGTLSGAGTGSVTIAVPNIPTIVGASVYAAFLVADGTSPTGVGTISPDLAIVLQ